MPLNQASFKPDAAHVPGGEGSWMPHLRTRSGLLLLILAGSMHRACQALSKGV